VNAGVWSSSVHGFQPWRFVAIANRNIISRISNTIDAKSLRFSKGIKTIVKLTAKAMLGSPFIVLVYNTKTFSKIVCRFYNKGKQYQRITEISEIEAISAAMQNMILEAETLGISSCWTVAPVCCQKEINTIVEEENDLIGIILFGYAAEEGRRSRRIDPEISIRSIE
jgi:nitroreductase